MSLTLSLCVVIAVNLLHLIVNLCLDTPAWIYDSELGLEPGHAREGDRVTK